MVAALSRLCVVPIDVVDRLMGGDRPDPILILCKSAGWEWPTVKALIMARPGNKGASSAGLDTAFSNFERLSPATAQRVMRFWQARPAGNSAARLVAFSAAGRSNSRERGPRASPWPRSASR